MARRGSALGAGSGRLWEPSPERPQLVVVIDEFADLAGPQMALLFEVARKGRALGISLIIATQRPSESALGAGGTDVRAQFSGQIGLRLRSGDERLVFGDGMAQQGWITSGFTEPGSFLISSPQHEAPRPARASLTRDSDIKSDVRAWAGKAPGLDLGSAEAIGQLRRVGDQDEIPAIAGTEPGRVVTVAAFALELRCSDSKARQELAQMVERGEARKSGRGSWELLDSNDDNNPRLHVLGS
jgi:hypothetical protein